MAKGTLQMWLKWGDKMERLFWIRWVAQWESKGPLKVEEGVRRVRGGARPRKKVRERPHCWLWRWRKETMNQKVQPAASGSWFHSRVSRKVPSSAHTLTLAPGAILPSPVWFQVLTTWLLCDPMDGSPPGCSVHGILQARILEWVTISSSRGSSRPRDRTHVFCVSCIGRRVLYC